MPRGIRNAAPLKLPDGVRLSKWIPIISVPRSGPTKQMRRQEGTDLAQQRRQQSDPNAGQPLRLRYAPCCEEHKKEMTLAALESPAQLLFRCQSLAKDQGHFDLLPKQATLEWQKDEDNTPCRDCIEEACEVLGISATRLLNEHGAKQDISSAELLQKIEAAQRSEKAA